MSENTSPIEYRVIVTDSGRWLFSASSVFMFAFIEKGSKDAETITNAFIDALKTSIKITKAVKTTTGQDVTDGLYAIDHESMLKAMNSIKGMGQTSVDDGEKKGKGKVDSIIQQFFEAVLKELNENFQPLQDYLTKALSQVQQQTKKTKVDKDFGIVIGFVSLMPVLEVPVTIFKYVYTSEKTSKWFNGVHCKSTTPCDYDYKYTIVTYNYTKPA